MYFSYSLFVSHLHTHLSECDVKLPDVLMTHQASVTILNTLVNSEYVCLCVSECDVKLPDTHQASVTILNTLVNSEYVCVSVCLCVSECDVKLPDTSDHPEHPS